MSGPLFPELQARFGAAVREGRREPPFEVVEVESGAVAEVAGWLKTSCGFEVLMDLVAVDYRGYPGAPRPARFELVYYFFSLSANRRLRVKVPVSEENPVVPSLTRIFASANWLEREVWDMFGVRFAGHPDLRRLLMYEEFSGHPLRKDYPLDRQQPRVAQDFPGVPPFGPPPPRLRGEGT